MCTYRTFLDAIERIQFALIVVLFVAMTVVVVFQVVNRFILQWPILWTADVSVICFVWLSLLCVSLAVRHHGHFRVSALIDRNWGPPVKAVLELISLAVIMLLSGALTIYGAYVAIDGIREVSPGLGIPMVWAYASVPVCSTTAFLFAVENALGQVRGAAIAPSHAEEAP